MNTYCGPFVLSYVLKITPDEAAAKVRALSTELRHRNGVKGMWCTTMEDVLQKTVGIKAKVVEPRCRLKTWAAIRMRWNDTGTWVILVTGHYVVYRKGVIYDTSAKDGLPFQFHNASKRRLRRAWYIGDTHA